MSDFKPGDKVRLVCGISEMEKDLLAKGHVAFVVRRMDRTHGYAVIEDEWGAWHVHPEALDRISEGGNS